MNGIVAIMEFNPFCCTLLAWFDSQLGQRAFELFAMLGFAKKSTRVGGGHGEEPAPLDSLPSPSWVRPF